MKYQIVTSAYCQPISLDEAKLHLRVDGSDEDVEIRNLIKTATEYCQNYQGRLYVACGLTAKFDEFTEKMRLPRGPLISVDSVKYIDTTGVLQTLSSSVYVVDTVEEPGEVRQAYDQYWPDARCDADVITIAYKVGYITPCIISATNNTITTKGRMFANGDTVRFTVSGGNTAALPAGISDGIDYYVIQASGETFKISTTAGGEAVDITSTGTGTVFIGELPGNIRSAILLMTGHLYANREPVNIGNITTELPMSVKALLEQDRIYNS